MFQQQIQVIAIKLRRLSTFEVKEVFQVQALWPFTDHFIQVYKPPTLLAKYCKFFTIFGQHFIIIKISLQSKNS